MSMYFVNEMTGYLGDDNGIISKITNGGNDIQEVYTGVKDFISASSAAVSAILISWFFMSFQNA